MFILLLRYLKPLSEVDRFVGEHRKFLARYYASGHFLLSGRKEPRDGGVILAAAASRAEVAGIVAQDPFYREQIAQYEIVEFEPSMATENLSHLIVP